MPGRDQGDIIVGIDLGTTNSLVAVAGPDGPRVLAGPGEDALVPSVVRYEPDAASPGGLRTVVGRDAADRAVEFPLTSVSSVKRLMGRGMADAAGDARYFSFRLAAGEQDTARIAIPTPAGERVLSPQEVSAAILRALRARAEAALGTPVRRAVVTVPAYFDDAQRQATRDAGRLAGLDVVRIVNEPTAAALAYGLGTARDAARNAGPRTVAVYDLGGGTFDVSILRLTPGAAVGGATDFFQVLATAGDTHLGGDDIDHALTARIIDGMASELGRPVELASLDPSTRRAVLGFARGVKHRLSEAAAAPVRIDLGDGRVFERVFTRDELEALAAPLVERTIAACDRALRDAARQSGGPIELDAVVLVGGSTRMPMVRGRVAAFFGIEPYTALDPDRVVALGAAVQAGLLSGAASGALLLDVIPLSLGIETRGGAVAKLVVRNSPVPARATEMFSTAVDGQTSIKLAVYQGEREMAEDCRKLGEFHLSGLPPMPAGVPQVEVEFLVDANGVLRVNAHERRSGKRADLQVIPNHGLTAAEVERMEAESLAHAREDMTRHRVVDLITNARLDMKWIGERLDRHRALLDPAYADGLTARLAELRAAVERADADWRSVSPDELYRLKQGLDEASVRLQEVGIAESLRGSGSGGGSGGDGGGAGPAA